MSDCGASALGLALLSMEALSQIKINSL